MKYFANKGFNGIDTSGVAVLEYEDKQAICVGGKDCKSLNRTTIMAANGYVELNSAPNVFTDFLVNIDQIKELFVKMNMIRIWFTNLKNSVNYIKIKI